MQTNLNIKNQWYHGSNLKLYFLDSGSTITQWRELALAFSHKPKILIIQDDNSIIHNGQEFGYLYVIDELIDIDKCVCPHPKSTMDSGLEFLTNRRLRLRLIEEIGTVSKDYLDEADMIISKCIKSNTL